MPRSRPGLTRLAYTVYERRLLRALRTERLPAHIGVVVDSTLR